MRKLIIISSCTFLLGIILGYQFGKSNEVENPNEINKTSALKVTSHLTSDESTQTLGSSIPLQSASNITANKKFLLPKRIKPLSIDETSWQNILLHSENEHEKIEAITYFANSDDIKNLAMGLADNSQSVRKEVIIALGDIESEHALTVLGQVIFSENEPENRIAALKILEKNQNYEFVKQFIAHAILHDADSEVRAQAQRSLEY